MWIDLLTSKNKHFRRDRRDRGGERRIGSGRIQIDRERDRDVRDRDLRDRDSRDRDTRDGRDHRDIRDRMLEITETGTTEI